MLFLSQSVFLTFIIFLFILSLFLHIFLFLHVILISFFHILISFIFLPPLSDSFSHFCFSRFSSHYFFSMLSFSFLKTFLPLSVFIHFYNFIFRRQKFSLFSSFSFPTLNKLLSHYSISYPIFFPHFSWYIFLILLVFIIFSFPFLYLFLYISYYLFLSSFHSSEQLNVKMF